MRIALGIEYQGKNYAGFQRQNHADTVQGQLERALSFIADEDIKLNCAGRTDTGVNATGQVVSFDVIKERPDRAWLLGTNTKLPHDIAVTWARHVDESFHARFSAKARRYRYVLQNTDYRPAILNGGVSTYMGSYDVQAMHEAAQLLLGERDFSAFKASDDESHSFFRCVHFINVQRIGPYIVFDIQANAFLHHMVRNIVGSLLEVGCKKQDKEWLAYVLESKDRNKAGPTAFANGLYLVDVIYPDEFKLPKRDFLGPLWFR